MSRPGLTATSLPRRRLLAAAGGGVACALHAELALAAAALPRMTEGPFYPSPAYRGRSLDWDADLTRVTRAASGDAPRAAGEWLDLHGRVVDAAGRAIDGAAVEIWQCDVHGSYRHPRGAGAEIDAAFQGFGTTITDSQGRYRFRTIRPAPYPGRTPHIHVKLRHPAVGELISQLFVAGDPDNARDFLWRALSDAQREAAEMRLQRAPPGAEVTWVSERSLVIG